MANQARKKKAAAPRKKAAASIDSRKTAVKTENRKESKESGIPMANEIELIASLGIMVLMMLSNFGLCGYLGKALSSFFFGVFGCVQYVMPIAFCIGVFILIANDYSLLSIKKCTAGFVTLLMISAFAQIIYQGDPVKSSELFSQAIEDHHAGGILGGGIGLVLKNGFGTAGALVIVFCLMMLSLIMLTQRSFVGFFQNNVDRGGRLMDKIRENRAITKEHRRQAQELRRQEAELRREELAEEEEEDERTISFRRRRSAKKTDEEPDSSERIKKIEEKLKQIQEARSSKGKKTAQDAKEKLKKEPEIHRNVPVFTSSEEVKKKDAVVELQPKVYPITAEDNKTRDFEAELDFSAFSFADDESRDALSSEIGRNPLKLRSFLNSLEEYEPPARTNKVSLSELKAQAEKTESREGGLESGPEENGLTHEESSEGRHDQDNAGVMFDEENAGTLQDEENGGDLQYGDSSGASLMDQKESALPEEIYLSGYQTPSGQTEEGIVPTGKHDRPKAGSGSDLLISDDQDEEIIIPEEADYETLSGIPEPVIEVPAGQEAARTRYEEGPDSQKKTASAAIGPGPKADGMDKPGNTGSDIRINRAGKLAAVSERKPARGQDYIFPPIGLLVSEENDWSEDYDQELKETAMKLQQTLESFGVRVTITDISCGPSVTRYEMFPEQGTKVSKIVSLTDDIKLNLAAADIRIEAPIPGKAAIGIEVPNKTTMTVHIREMFDNRIFRNFRSKLAFAVGKDIGGNIVVTDLAKMPHLLIAGATGSGKSVCINTLIMSLLYKARPDEVKLIMIDPKMVELNVYNGIPHLLIPVVTDPKKASGALNWAVAEMTDRYKKFAETNVRNLEGYNKKVDSLIASGEVDPDKLSRMPQIVIIIDELADLMMVAPGEVEDAIVRLSQLARAAGIHLVIATQRPSVNVITGLIKANVPSRIAFSVSSGVDSRTIIDMNGAEKLLGKGDMLFYPAGYQKPVRVQGALVDDSEVARVVEFIKSNEDVAVYDSSLTDSIEKKIVNGGGSSEKDEYFEAAARFIMEKDKATIGMLQRMFKIGFNRAARIMDQLADAGIVGPEEGTKPRQILMSPEQLDQYLEEYV